jgi:tetratricopeptide (TPR) repeat protein
MPVRRLPLCFVVMPFGVKPDGEGGSVDFDAVYADLLAPAIRDAELDPLRADEELVGGLIHKPMFERLILADYAVADLTTANANVFYEVGVRHAVRPYSTVLVSANVKRAPFDLAPDRVFPYRLDARGRPADAAAERVTVAVALRAARAAATDSPVFQLIDDLPRPEIDRLKTDLFREQAAYSADVKASLAEARGAGVEKVREVEQSLGAPEDVEAGVLVDLVLSYRAVEAWEDMIRMVSAMPEPLRRTVMVREQYGFALNRAGRGEEAERVLLEVIDKAGSSSETLGLLGRVYKDRWEAQRRGSVLLAEGHLDNAIDAYRRGFEADWRDAYPGVNAVTLMEIRSPGGAEQQELLPVVRYANRRRIEGRRADYWDHATRLELGVVGRDRDEAMAGARAALPVVREAWEPESTAYNLSLIRESRVARGEEIAWADELEQELLRAAGKA